MWLKEENNKLVPPPATFQSPEGWIVNFSQSPKQMVKYGWRYWTAQQIEEWKEEHPEPTVPVTTCTKYQLVTCLQKYFPELLEALRTAYQQSPDLQFYWNSVLDLDRNNADFQNLAAALGVSEEQLDEIFSKIDVI